MFDGSVYMASTVSNSCQVWNKQVSKAAMGPLGDLEHLRPLLGRGTPLEKNALVWMTDATPHESLPLSAGTKRQYFRLVTSRVTAWYADHSTPNPLGVEPPEEVAIVHGNKFAGAAPAAPAPSDYTTVPLSDPRPSRSAAKVADGAGDDGTAADAAVEDARERLDNAHC